MTPAPTNPSPGRPPGRQRPAAVALWVAALVVAAVQSWAGLRRPLPDRLSDLQVYLGAVDLLRDGGSLYDFAAAATGAPFTYPPFAGLVFLPLSPLPFTVVAFAWCVVTVAMVVALARTVARRSRLRYASSPLLPPLAALALFASAPVSSNLRFGQVSVLLVAAVLVDALGVVPARYRGVATGVAGAVKLTPLIFVPYYWLSGQRRTAVTAVVTFAVCTASAWLVLPGDSHRFWLTKVWDVNRVGNITTGGNQSLNGVLLRLDTPEQARTVVAGVVGAAVVLLALARAVRAYRNDQPLAAVVMVGAAGLAFSPVSWTHHQVWLVLAALVPVSTRARVNAAWAGLVLAVMLLPVTAWSSDVVTANARLWLAVCVAAAVPFLAVRAAAPASTDGRDLDRSR